MNLKELAIRNRSTRRFVESETIDRSRLRALVDLARICPSGGNVQPLKYLISCDPATNERIFPALRWASALPDWPGPEPGQRPSAYILILLDNQIASSAGCDHGIASQTMMLAAVEDGLAGCLMGALDREGLRSALAIPPRYDILLALALGKPAESIHLDPLPESGDTSYYRDDNDEHHVPKRALEDVLVDF